MQTLTYNDFGIYISKDNYTLWIITLSGTFYNINTEFND